MPKNPLNLLRIVGGQRKALVVRCESDQDADWIKLLRDGQAREEELQVIDAALERYQRGEASEE